MDTRSGICFPILPPSGGRLRSPNQLKDSTSEFGAIDTLSLNIVYENKEDIVDKSDDVPSDMLIQNRRYGEIAGCSDNEQVLVGLNNI